MTLTELRSPYPRCYRLFSRLVNERRCDQRAIEGLTQPALLRIEGGETTEQDARLLLEARSVKWRRR